MLVWDIPVHVDGHRFIPVTMHPQDGNLLALLEASGGGSEFVEQLAANIVSGRQEKRRELTWLMVS